MSVARLVLLDVSTLDDTAAQAVRASRDPEVVTEYAAAMSAGVDLPALKACEDGDGKIWVWDGGYRIAAAKQAQVPQLYVQLSPGDYADALALARREGNVQHGVRRSNADKARICTDICAEELARQDRGEKPTPSRDLGALAGGTRDAPAISHTAVNKELKRLRAERDAKAAAEREQAEQEAVLRDLIPRAFALGFAVLKTGYIGSVVLDLSDADAALATLPQPWAKKAAIDALTAIAARNPLLTPRFSDAVRLADGRVVIVTGTKLYYPAMRVLSTAGEQRFPVSLDAWPALVAGGTVLQAAVARPPADPSTDPTWEPPPVADGGLDWVADGSCEAWPEVPAELLPTGWTSLRESREQATSGNALPASEAPKKATATDAGSDAPIKGQVLLSGAVVTDAEERADAILADFASEGDARPVEFMAGREGRPCAWAVDTVEAALWRRGRLYLDELVDAGVVRVAPAISPSGEPCSACAVPTDRIEPSPTAYPLCWRCAVQARDEALADLARSQPSRALPLTEALLRRIVELLDADDISMRNRGIPAGPAADRLDIHRFGETLTLSEPFSVADFRAALAELGQESPPVAVSPIMASLEAIGIVDLVGALPDAEIATMVGVEVDEFRAWHEGLGIPLATHLRPEPAPVPDFDDIPTPDRDALEADLRDFQASQGELVPWVQVVLEGLISMGDAGLRRVAERLGEARAAQAAVLRYGLSDGGDRSTNEDLLDMGSLPVTLGLRPETCALIASRLAAGITWDLIAGEVGWECATLQRHYSAAQAEPEISPAPPPADNAENTDAVDEAPAGVENSSTLSSRLEALLTAGVENLPPLSGDGPSLSVFGCLTSLDVYGPDVLADLTARVEVAEKALRRPVAPIQDILAALPQAVEVAGQIPATWLRWLREGKLGADNESEIREAYRARIAAAVAS